jgi:hypothetical protein
VENRALRFRFIGVISATLCCALLVDSGCGNPSNSGSGSPSLGISPTHIEFGNVSVNTTAPPQAVTLTSVGTHAVTVTAAAVTGTGFAVSGVSFPISLVPGQTALLDVHFDPTAAGAAAGQLTIASNSANNSSAVVALSGTGVPAASMGPTYYLAPAADGGNDSNSGLSEATPWLSPHHALNCGDVIVAAPSASYSPANFTYNSWGTVTCAAGNNVAWLTCATFDGCRINSTGGIVIDQSYWGVQGWEVHATGTLAAACFAAAPNYATPAQIHHIVFANDIANGCQDGGFTSYSQNTVSVDYLAVVGSIAFNAAQGSDHCYSGISVYQPAQSDSMPGTHIYVAGNFSWANFDPNPCQGGAPTDGEGIIFDTFDGRNGLTSPYGAQAVAENNLLFANGGKGLEVYANDVGTPPYASIYFMHNTLWGNNGDSNQNSSYCGELLIAEAFNVTASNNLAVTNAALGCGRNPIYAYYVGSSNTTSDEVNNSWGYSASGTSDAVSSSTGFSYGPNDTFGIDPKLANPFAPGAPNCSDTSSVPDCMAAAIANFTPTTAAAIRTGYQPPGNAPVNDPLFPQWLCNVNLPPGLISVSCATASSAIRGILSRR